MLSSDKLPVADPGSARDTPTSVQILSLSYFGKHIAK